MQKKKPLSLNNAFWSKFSRTYWEKRPGLFQNVDSPILAIGPADIFEILVDYSDYCRKTQTSGGLKFFIEGQPQYEDEILRVLPLRSDQSLEGYHARMKVQFADYCLVCDELMRVDNPKWDLVLAFMRSLYAHVGVPNRCAEIGLYLGNYRTTPFGVHVDGCGVFSIPVVGKKLFRLWSPKFVEKNPALQESHHYQPYKKHSQVLKAQSGDVAYWPSSSWHIAESNGEFNATWSVGIWLDRKYSETQLATVAPLLSQKLGSDSNKTTLAFRSPPREDGYIKEIPEPLRKSISSLYGLSKAELKEVFLQAWLQTFSRSAFKESPKITSAATLKTTDMVQKKSIQPIFWSELSKRTLCLAVNGEVLKVPHQKSTLKMIQHLNRGGQCAVKEKPYLIRWLYAARGVTKVTPLR